jgi:hypothetical protein
MRKTVFFYCWQVWITSALSAPIFYYTWTFPDRPTILGFLGFYGLAILYGLILSFPSMCCFWAGAAFLFSRLWPRKTQKILLCGWASLLTVVPFWLIFGKDDPNTLHEIVKMAICYLLTILIGIWCFQLPSKVRA